MFLVGTIGKFLKTGEKRSVQLKKNIINSFLIKGLSISINFLIVPISIKYVSPVQYGVWLALTSIISWFTFFDFGMGNGLRNRLTTAIAFNEYETAKKYISTAYATFSLIALSVFVLFFLVNPYVNWNSFLNIPLSVDENIQSVLLVVLASFCVQFVVQLINTVLVSIQEPAKAEAITLLGQAGLLFVLLLLKTTVKGSLGLLVLVLNVTPLIIMFLASVVFYQSKLKFIAPSIKSIEFSYAKNILNTGSAFFLIQIGALVLFQTDNIIISRILGPIAVTKFNVAYKLYSVIIMAFSIIVTPYWSAFTEAYANRDYRWIEGSIKKLRRIWLFTSFVIVPVFFILAKYIFKLWLPNTVTINITLSLLMAVYVICYTCLALNCYFLNGIGKLKIQIILYLFITLTNIPLGIVLGKTMGIEGVIIANIIAFVLMNIVLWIQTNKIVQQRAIGIWNS